MSQGGLTGLATHADPSPSQCLALAGGRSSLGEPGILLLPAARTYRCYLTEPRAMDTLRP